MACLDRCTHNAGSCAPVPIHSFVFCVLVVRHLATVLLDFVDLISHFAYPNCVFNCQSQIILRVVLVSVTWQHSSSKC